MAATTQVQAVTATGEQHPQSLGCSRLQRPRMARRRIGGRRPQSLVATAAEGTASEHAAHKRRYWGCEGVETAGAHHSGRIMRCSRRHVAPAVVRSWQAAKLCVANWGHFPTNRANWPGDGGSLDRTPPPGDDAAARGLNGPTGGKSSAGADVGEDGSRGNGEFEGRLIIDGPTPAALFAGRHLSARRPRSVIGTIDILSTVQAVGSASIFTAPSRTLHSHLRIGHRVDSTNPHILSNRWR